MRLVSALEKVGFLYDVKQGLDIIDQISFDDIAIDSRLINSSLSTVFFALKGVDTNGEKFIPSVVKSGCRIVIAKNYTKINSDDVVFITCDNPFDLLTQMLQIFYGPLPSDIYAVTGTNGKTSVVEFTRQIFGILNIKAASIGTLGLVCDDIGNSDFVSSSLTTPDIVGLYKNLSILKKNGVDHVAIEASSIGLDQKRMEGVEIKSAAFTNFSQDHLDYHNDMDSYFAAKLILFDSLLENSSNVVLNADIEEFQALKNICANRNHNVLDYGYSANAIKLVKINERTNGQEVGILYNNKSYSFFININVNFQVFNLICALGLVVANNEISDNEFEKLLANFTDLKSATGRMQKVADYKGAQIFVDYAHTPDALEISLKNARKFKPTRILTLFGCGGDRDHAKRPLMGKIACQNSDLVIVTDDNPRTENPEQIRRGIIANCDNNKTIEIDNRKSAIEKSLQMLEKGDIIILAGKGHEKYQSVNGQKIDFDEIEIINNIIANK